MLADFPLKEVDYSFLQTQVGDKVLPEIAVTKRQFSNVLLVAFGISIAVHALLLIIQLRHSRFEAPLQQSTRLSVELKQIIAPQSELAAEPNASAEESSAPKLDKEHLVVSELSESISPVVPTPSKAKALTKTTARVIQPLTNDDLRDIVQSSAAERDQSPAPSGDIAANVFHPELRKRLQEEASKPKLKRVEDKDGLESHIDSSGATIVDLGGGRCLRSPPTKVGEAKNWFMVSCGGKTESEQMMDRVNQEVKARFK